jgi:hypothetical protein
MGGDFNPLSYAYFGAQGLPIFFVQKGANRDLEIGNGY